MGNIHSDEAPKKRRVSSIKDLDDANLAGTEYSSECTLILTEGTATKSLAAAGLSITGRDKYGVYPLKHNFTNVRKHREDEANDIDIINVIAILGLDFNRTYGTYEELRTLRYGKVMLMMDRDEDGSHTKGLIINFFHRFWPLLLRRPFLVQFITPVVNVFHDNYNLRFYTFEEYEEFKKKIGDKNISAVFYKSLESFSPSEIREYFSFLDRHVVNFSYNGPDDGAAIELAFDKYREDDRKQWIANLRNESIRYYEGIKEVTFEDFIYKELLLYSELHNERSIASVVDGLTRSQRKVLYTFFEKKIGHEVNLLQLVGSIFEVSGYKQNEISLSQTIIKMGQDFVGTNNINILLPIGQFGSRIRGGKDAGKAKFLRTKLNDLTNFIFSDLDQPMLERRHLMEPTFYVPIIPLILVNGAEGIGTGWKTLIPNYNPLDIIRNIFRLMDGLEPVEMTPWYKNFKGTIQKVDEKRFKVSGVISVLDDDKIRISELPVGEWIQKYKEKVLNPMLVTSENGDSCILDYTEYHTDTAIDFVVTPSMKLINLTEEQLHTTFKLDKIINMSNIVAFNTDGSIKKYENPAEILKDFYKIRQEFYELRRSYMIRNLKLKLNELKSLEQRVSKNPEGITVQNPDRGESICIKREYLEDKKLNVMNGQRAHASDVAENYNFLSNLWDIVQEKIETMKTECDTLVKEIEVLEKSTAVDLWKNELEILFEKLKLFPEFTHVNEDSTGAPSSIYGPQTSTPKASSTSVPSIEEVNKHFSSFQIM